MSEKIQKIRDAARDQVCIVPGCGCRVGGCEWRAIPSYEGRYEISSCGAARSLARIIHRDGSNFRQAARIISPNHAGRARYKQLHLYTDAERKTMYVHDAVLTAFVGPRPVGNQACHGPLGNQVNSVDNLRWATRAENIADSVAAGSQKGIKNPSARLTESDVRSIRLAWVEGEPAYMIASVFGISHDYVYTIVKRKAWAHVK